MNAVTTREDASQDIVDMLRDSAREYAAGQRDHKKLRERAGRLPGIDLAGFAQLQALGWRSALIAENLGGAGVGLRAAAAIVEELGRSLLGDPYTATAVLPIRLLQDPAAPDSALALLREAASGQRTFALAWQEAPGSIEPAGTTQAVRVGSDLVCTGRKRWVAGASGASDLLVTARLDGGTAVLQVPLNAVGLTPSIAWQVDGTPSTDFHFDNVRLPGSALVVGPADGAAATGRAIDAAAIVASAELLGVARAVFDMTLAYMRTRVQFDKPIGSFQALQHKAVDLLVQRELAAAVLEEAVAAGDRPDGSAELSRLASRCKARCSDMALRVTRECVQLHGAIGYTDEYDVGLYLKRALVLAAWLGNGAQQRARWTTSTR